MNIKWASSLGLQTTEPSPISLIVTPHTSQLKMSANKPDTSNVHTPTDSGGPTPIGSRWDLTVVPATPPAPARASTVPSVSSSVGAGETARLLATKQPRYWTGAGDATDSEAEDARGRSSTTNGARRRNEREGEWQRRLVEVCRSLWRNVRPSTAHARDVRCARFVSKDKHKLMLRVDGVDTAPAEGVARCLENPPALKVLRPRAF